MKTRRCNNCHVTKPMNDFNRRYDGFQYQCRDCQSKFHKSRSHIPEVKKRKIERHRKWYKEKGEEYYHRPEVKRKVTEYQKKQRNTEEGKLRTKAVNALSWAVKTGKVQKKSCIVCQKTPVHGHHEDYFKPLIVIWMCPKCHKNYHIRKRKIK